MFLIDCVEGGGSATKSLGEAVMKLMSVNGVKRALVLEVIGATKLADSGGC